MNNISPNVTNKIIKNVNKTVNRNLAKNISKNVAQNTTRTFTTGQQISLGLLLFVSVVVISLLTYFLLKKCENKKPILSYLKDVFRLRLEPCDKEKEKEIKNKIHLPLAPREEVYHIGNQDYTYPQAKCKCESYGGRLATKAEITNAYNQGGEWCTYGWSHGQNAFYPTQNETFEKKQRGPRKDRFSCGYPGVNGGFFPNPKLKFGANCYGVKPKGKAFVPKSIVKPEVPFCERKNNHQASSRLDTDEVTPFNAGKWSMY
jgi:hypothetical protein